MLTDDGAEVGASGPAAGQRDETGGHETGDDGLGDGEVEQRRGRHMVDGEVVPQRVPGDERPDEAAPREAASHPAGRVIPTRQMSWVGRVIPAPRAHGDDGDAGEHGERPDDLDTRQPLPEDGDGDDDREHRPDAAGTRVDDAERRMIVACLQRHRVPDVEESAEQGRGEQTPVDRLPPGGDEPDRDRGEEKRTETVVGEDERVAAAGHRLRREVPHGVRDRGAEDEREDFRRHLRPQRRGVGRAWMRRACVGRAGGNRAIQSLMTTVFVCVYSSRASIDFSRPYPDFLNPPNGSSTPPPAPYVLTKTCPASTSAASRCARDRLCVHSAETSP